MLECFAIKNLNICEHMKVYTKKYFKYWDIEK